MTKFLPLLPSSTARIYFDASLHSFSFSNPLKIPLLFILIQVTLSSGSFISSFTPSIIAFHRSYWPTFVLRPQLNQVWTDKGKQGQLAINWTSIYAFCPLVRSPWKASRIPLNEEKIKDLKGDPKWKKRPSKNSLSRYLINFHRRKTAVRFSLIFVTLVHVPWVIPLIEQTMYYVKTLI